MFSEFSRATATLALLILYGTSCGLAERVFTVINNCDHTIWPAVQTGFGGPPLADGGFVLKPMRSFSITAPDGWSGRFWGRTNCRFNSTGHGRCLTGDCGRVLKCQDAIGVPPITQAEFSLASMETDFYDVSVDHGFNLPMSVKPVGGTGKCETASCAADLLTSCPPELSIHRKKRPEEVLGCNSACGAFGGDEYCCTGDYGNSKPCLPNRYSLLFKGFCPTAYSFKDDDSSLTFACSKQAQYTITFCPGSG